MYELKTGNGGRGLEPYNKKTGKYEKIEFSFEGNRISDWEDLKKIYFDADQQKAYDEASEEDRKPIDDYLKDVYNQLLQGEVDRLNDEEAKTDIHRMFDSVDDAIENGHVLFHDEMINTYFNEPYILNYHGIRRVSRIAGEAPDRRYDKKNVPLLPMLLQNSRYEKHKMNRISEDDYKSRINNIIDPVYNDNDYFHNDSGTYARLKNFINNNKDIPVFRGIPCDSSEKTNIHKGYFEDGQGISKSNLGRGYYSSVIYMSLHSGYADGYSGSNGIVLRGFIKNDNLKICYMENFSNDWGHNRNIDEFRIKSPIFINNLKMKMIESGKYNKSQIDDFAGQVQKCVEDDDGFVAMLLGYDALLGRDHQFDALNPGVVDLVKE